MKIYCGRPAIYFNGCHPAAADLWNNKWIFAAEPHDRGLLKIMYTSWTGKSRIYDIIDNPPHIVPVKKLIPGTVGFSGNRKGCVFYDNSGDVPVLVFNKGYKLSPKEMLAELWHPQIILKTLQAAVVRPDEPDGDIVARVRLFGLPFQLPMNDVAFAWGHVLAGEFEPRNDFVIELPFGARPLGRTFAVRSDDSTLYKTNGFWLTERVPDDCFYDQMEAQKPFSIEPGTWLYPVDQDNFYSVSEKRGGFMFKKQLSGSKIVDSAKGLIEKIFDGEDGEEIQPIQFFAPIN